MPLRISIKQRDKIIGLEGHAKARCLEGSL